MLEIGGRELVKLFALQPSKSSMSLQSQIQQSCLWSPELTPMKLTDENILEVFFQ